MDANTSTDILFENTSISILDAGNGTQQVMQSFFDANASSDVLFDNTESHISYLEASNITQQV